MDGAQPDSGQCESSAFAQASGVVLSGAVLSGAVLRNKGKANHSMPAESMSADEFLTFQKLSAEQRKDLPASAYAYTDPQGGTHLPIHDISHLHTAIAQLDKKKTLKEFMGKKERAALQATLQARLSRAEHTYDETIASDVAIFDLGPDQDNDSLISAEPDSDVVIRRGLVFRSGSYADKNFELSPKELKRVVKNFEGPVLIDSEHERSIFDGKLGQLMSVEASKDGTELHGLVAIPKWLDPILMAAGGKVSAAFDRATKKLVGLALTINPRVSDAALMAAFSTDMAAHGAVSVDDLISMAKKDDKKMGKKQAKQDPKAAKPNDDGDDTEPDDDDDDDAPASKQAKHSDVTDNKFSGYDGMVPKGGAASQSGQVKMATSSGRGMMQAIHDTTASRGAVCRVEPQPATTIGPYGIVRYASKGEMDVIQTIHDTTLQNGASCTPSLYGQQDVPGGLPWTWQWPGVGSEGRTSMPGETKAPHFSNGTDGGQKAMKALAKFMETLDEVDPRYGQPKNSQDSQAAVRRESNNAPSGDAEFRRLDEENARLREENRHMLMQGILNRAVVFADKMVQEGHATPVEREGIVTVHAQLEHDDTFTATATFSNGMSRVAAYEASILARPNNLLAAELLPSAVQQGLIKFANMTTTPVNNADAGGKMTDERKRQLTNLDPVLKRHAEAVYGAQNGSTNGHSR